MSREQDTVGLSFPQSFAITPEQIRESAYTLAEWAARDPELLRGALTAQLSLMRWELGRGIERRLRERDRPGSVWGLEEIIEVVVEALREPEPADETDYSQGTEHGWTET